MDSQNDKKQVFIAVYPLWLIVHNGYYVSDSGRIQPNKQSKFALRVVLGQRYLLSYSERDYSVNEMKKHRKLMGGAPMSVTPEEMAEIVMSLSLTFVEEIGLIIDDLHHYPKNRIPYTSVIQDLPPAPGRGETD